MIKDCHLLVLIPYSGKMIFLLDGRKRHLAVKTTWLWAGLLGRAIDVSQVIRGCSLRAELGRKLTTDDVNEEYSSVSKYFFKMCALYSGLMITF